MARHARHVPPEEIPAQLDLARTLFENGELEEARDLVDAVLLSGPRGEDEVETYYLRAEILLDLDEPRQAILAYQAAATAAPGDPQVLSGLGEAHFRLWDFPRALAAFEKALACDPKSPRAHRGAAQALDRLGKRKLADMHFARASKLDPEGSPPPVRIAKEEFDREARDAIASLPAEIKARLGEIGFRVMDHPVLSMIADRPDDADPGTLGLYFGDALDAPAAARDWRFVPNHIFLFQRNLEEYARTREELLEEIRTTIFHEIGHHLGYDEDGLDEIGLA